MRGVERMTVLLKVFDPCIDMGFHYQWNKNDAKPWLRGGTALQSQDCEGAASHLVESSPIA